MSFWESHRGALTLMILGAFLLLAGYFGLISPAGRDAVKIRQQLGAANKELIKYYPGLDSSKTFSQPEIRQVMRQCRDIYEHDTLQIEGLKKVLRFPFDKWTEAPPKLRSDEYRWIVDKEYTDVKNRVEGNRRSKNSAVHFEKDWGSGFIPPPSVPKNFDQEWAVRELRKLCLAQRISELAIDAKVSEVLKITPENVEEEAARNPNYRKGSRNQAEQEFYANRFIVNYPVSIEMVGSLQSIVDFFKSVRKDKSFLVIRSFRIVSPEDPEVKGHIGRNDVHVRISAACMDFNVDKKPARVEAPVYRPPTEPLGS